MNRRSCMLGLLSLIGVGSIFDLEEREQWVWYCRKTNRGWQVHCYDGTVAISKMGPFFDSMIVKLRKLKFDDEYEWEVISFRVPRPEDLK